MKYKRITAIGIIAIAMLVTAVFSYNLGVNNISIPGSVGVDLETGSIHCRIRMWQHGELIFDQYHSGVVTDLGDNVTLAKIFGDSDYNLTQYDMNATFISIGNDGGSLGASSTVLPGEWNRTAGTVEDEAASQLNITATIYPNDSGPYTADCIGLNLESGIGKDDALWAYDTFSEVTGIDETFTITIEFQISVSHS